MAVALQFESSFCLERMDRQAGAGMQNSVEAITWESDRSRDG